MSNLVVVQLTDDIQHVQLTNDMIQRFDRYEIESDEEEFQDDYTADIQRSLDESKLSIQRFDRYEIESDEEEFQDDYTADIQRSLDEEEYWYSVEQKRMKEEYWHLVEQLELEYGADIPTEDHPLIISTTLSIILEMELDDKQELDLQVDDTR